MLDYILFAMRNESTMVNSKINSDIAFLFNIAMHDPTIYLLWLPRGTPNDIDIVTLKCLQLERPDSTLGYSASLESER